MERVQLRTHDAPRPTEVLQSAGGAARDSLRRIVAAILDRSERGGAWHGAPDGVIYGALTAGAGLQVVGLSVLSTLGGAHDGLWWTSGVVPLPFVLHPISAYVAAFVMLSVAPVIEELLFRGALFAALRRALSTWGAAVASTAACVALHASVTFIATGFAMPLALLTVAALSASAMWLRIRHRALGPAIALNLGATFVALLWRALG